MTKTEKNATEQRIRIEGRHPLGLSAPILSPAFLQRKLALLSLAVTTRVAGRKREDASRVM